MAPVERPHALSVPGSHCASLFSRTATSRTNKLSPEKRPGETFTEIPRAYLNHLDKLRLVRCKLPEGKQGFPLRRDYNSNCLSTNQK